LAGLAALGVDPDAGFAQTEPARFRAEERERIVEQIGAAQEDEGLRSPSLISMLTDLGLFYQEEGDYALAAVALQEARHVVRVNFGLHTLEQLPLIEQALENAQAVGDIPMVQALEEEMLDLAKRHPDDLRTASIYRDAGRRRMDILRRLMAGDMPPEVYPEAGLWDVSKKAVMMDLVTQAQIHFTHAAEVILRNGLYSSGELRDLEMQIVRASDLFRERRELSTYSIHRDYHTVVFDLVLEVRSSIVSDLAGATGPDDPAWGFPFDGRTSRYELGRDSYRRLIAYAEAASELLPADAYAWQARIDAYLQLADWDLLYSRNAVAFDEYAQVHAMLESTDAAEPLIAAIFAPPLPVVLPTFVPNPLWTLESARYIDVTFDITKFGESRRVDVAGAAGDVSREEKAELVALIKASRFRPRVADGELGRTSPVTLRYYLSDD
jgi:hypothetical protein